MNANRKIEKKFFSKKKVFLLILITLVLLLILPFLRKLLITRNISLAIKNQLSDMKEQIKKNDNQNYTLKIQNSWNADSLIICRGYLHDSEELQLGLNKSGVEDKIANNILNHSRWTEGIHLYFIKNKSIMYIYCPSIYMENLQKDFIVVKTDKIIDLELFWNHKFELKIVK